MANKNKDFKHSKFYLAILIFIISISVRLWHLNDAGRAWDEQFIVEDGYDFVQLAKKFDFGNEFWWKENPDHPVLVRYVHGFISQLEFTGRGSDSKPQFTYDLTYNRIFSILLVSITAVIIFLFGKKHYSIFVGFIAGIIFSLLPILIGHSQLALYESFIIFFFTICVYFFFIFLEKPTIKRTLLVGILSGLAIQAKETNLLLYPLYFLIYFTQLINDKKAFNMQVVLPRIFGICTIGVVTFFAIWPMPLFHLDYMKQYILARRFETTYSIPEIFFGRLVLTPRVYFVVYFLITTPIVALFLFFVGLLKINSKKNWILYAYVLWFVFPFAQSFYHNRQHGIRYIIEIYAPLSLIAAIGFNAIAEKITKSAIKKTLIFIPIAFYFFVIILKTAPYYIDYFNEAVGGVNNVYDKRLFQIGWWGEGIKEAALFTGKKVKKNDTVGLALSPSHVMPAIPNAKVQMYDKNKTYNFVLVNYYHVIRDGFNIDEIYQKYELIYTVKVDNAALVFVFKKK